MIQTKIILLFGCFKIILRDGTVLRQCHLFCLYQIIKYSTIPNIAVIAQVVEHFHGKEKVDSASLSNGSNKKTSSVFRQKKFVLY